MLKRIAPVFLLALLAGAAGASAQAPFGIFAHRLTAGPIETIQRITVLQVPVGPASQAQQASIDAALDWMAGNGYLLDDEVGFDVSVGGNSITITVHVAGGPDITIVLGNGPFIPAPEPELFTNRLMTATIIRQISNGF